MLALCSACLWGMEEQPTQEGDQDSWAGNDYALRRSVFQQVIVVIESGRVESFTRNKENDEIGSIAEFGLVIFGSQILDTVSNIRGMPFQ